MKYTEAAATFLLVGFFFGVCTQACHIPTHVAKRETSTQTAEEQAIELIETFFPPCLTTETEFDGVDYSSVVAFFVEFSIWYQISTEVYCSGTNDTVECWSWRLQDVLRGGSIQLAAAKECVKQFFFYANFGLKEGTRFEVPKESETYTDQVNNVDCPDRTVEKYNLCVENYLLKYQDTVNPIPNFTSVLGFVENKVQCGTDNCNCGEVLSKDQDFQSYFESKSLNCDSCWSTRLGGLVERIRCSTRQLRSALRCFKIDSLLIEFLQD
uniref:Uncharacterized protein LOC100184265 n=1 Tax=Phallusia mammillata TaxID=59560 RepID=A0A6F9DIK5_9ASCI|nr:uncharacterized protein LOC100184265 [Phallusia mammillata]